MGIKQYISKQFGEPSGIGGYISTFVMNKMNQAQYKAVIENINVQADDKILDIGFGNGYLIKKLADRNLGTFYGIDISEDMIKNAIRNHNKLIEKKKINLMQGNVMEIPFKDNTFNFSYTVNTVYFWPSLEAGLLEIKRTLKEKGTFINVIYSKEWLEKISYTKYGFKKYTVEELKKQMKVCGFVKVEVIEIKKGKAYCIIGKKGSIDNEKDRN